MQSEQEQVMRMEGKLASMARTGRTAMVCFFVRADHDVFERLSHEIGAECVVGVVLSRDIAQGNGHIPDDE